MLFDVFDDDDGVVDDQADGQDHGEEGQGVDGEIEDLKGRKGPDDRNRHGQDWDERRPPFLQEDEDDEDDQEQRFDKGIFYFVDGRVDEIRVIHDNGIIQVRREGFLGLFQDLLDFRNRVQGVGIAGKLDAEANPCLAVDFGVAAFVLRPRLDIGHIFEVDELAIRGRLQDDIAELFRRRQLAFDFGAVLFFLCRRCRQAADGPGRSRHILFLDGRNDVGYGQAAFGQLFRIEPDAHGIAGTEGIDVADAVDALDFVEQVNIGVIFEERLIIRAVRRIDVGHEDHVAGRPADGQALGLYVAGQAVLGQIGVVLDVDGICIAVTVQAEDDGQAVRTVIA